MYGMCWVRYQSLQYFVSLLVKSLKIFYTTQPSLAIKASQVRLITLSSDSDIY